MPYNVTPTLGPLLREVLRGKSVSRTMTNLFWRDMEPLRGVILDIGGGGGRGSHYRFLICAPDAAVRTVDIVKRPGTDFVLDVTREKVPLPDQSAEYIFLFNILEHVHSHENVLAESHRLLKSSGKLLGTIPFLINVHPDPHDYARLTEESLRLLFQKHGFSITALEPIGRGPFLAAYEQLDSFIPRLCHAFFLPLAWFGDAILYLLKPRRNFRAQFPLAYNFILEKK